MERSISNEEEELVGKASAFLFDKASRNEHDAMMRVRRRLSFLEDEVADFIKIYDDGLETYAAAALRESLRKAGA